MAVSFPRTDLLTTLGLAQQSFDLVSLQELSRTAGGITRGKDLGPALWMVEYVTALSPFDDAVTFEAKLRSLDGVIKTFTAYDLRRSYPLAHADGNFTDSGKISSVGAGNKSLVLKELPAGFVLSIGDYLAFDYGSSPSSRALHQVVEAATANGSGTTGEFEVRPHIRSGATADIAVTLKKPSAIFTLTGGFNSAMHEAVAGSVSFKAVQYL